MLVFSLTVVEYFSKRVVNDVIKSEVSTGVRYFIGRATAKPGQKSDIESFLTSDISSNKHPTYWYIVVDRYL